MLGLETSRYRDGQIVLTLEYRRTGAVESEIVRFKLAVESATLLARILDSLTAASWSAERSEVRHQAGLSDPV